MKPLQIPLEQGKFYHIFNRGNNGDRMFYKSENYLFFLRRMDEYLLPYIDVYAYCLMSNHFHLLVRVKDRESEKVPVIAEKPLHLKDAKVLKNDDPVSQAFHRLFTSYSKAINKQEGRHGSLIENPFKRKEVTSEAYFSNLVCYIHANPQLHGVFDDFREYPWSSYQSILSEKQSRLKRDEVIGWFENKQKYVTLHSQAVLVDHLNELLLD